MESTPKLREVGHWHLPYLYDEDVERATTHVIEKILPRGDLYTEGWLEEQVKGLLFKMSAARCARVSYLNQDKLVPTVEEDLATFGKLMSGSRMHASPVEHQAQPDTKTVNLRDGTHRWHNPELHGNLVGWKQFRKTLWNENVPTNK